MDFEFGSNNLEINLRKLFKNAFITNCSLDDQSITVEESLTLKELEISEILENFKELLLSLLSFKRESKTFSETELINRNNQFESGLQKLEAEVRNHIRVQHQLKLYIEINKEKISELEKIEFADKSRIKELEKIIEKFTNKGNDIEKIQKDFDKKIENLESTINKLKDILEVKEKEILKKEIAKLKRNTPSSSKELHNSNVDLLKNQLKYSKIQRIIRDKSPVQHKDSIKTDRKLLGETDFSKFSSSPYLQNEGCINTFGKNYVKLQEKFYKNQGHIRSVSDQKLISHKGYYQKN